jgi:predicted enzyme related to lactoylglutathione lyase
MKTTSQEGLLLKVLKTFTRLYVDNLDLALPFYENIYGVKTQRRFTYPHLNVEVATVGDLMLLAGPKDACKSLSSIKATFIVDSLAEFLAYFNDVGIRVIRGPQQVPTGKNMTVQHSDGVLIEYVELMHA